MVYCDFEKGSSNPRFRSTLLIGREVVTTKSTLCTVLIMLTILDDPLTNLLFFLSVTEDALIKVGKLQELRKKRDADLDKAAD